MSKERLIEVYEDTISRCSGFDIPLSEKKTHSQLDLASIEHRSEIIVEPLDTVSALIKYVNLGKTAVLNMASSKRPGGGVANGKMAQEECLFRCSNLFTIPELFYPLESNEFIYTHQATFIKDGNYSIIYPMDADVITMAAPNLNKENKHYEEIVGDYEKLMIDKIENMLNIAAVNKCENIILGAWGCGVFKNDPKVVSILFKEVLKTKRFLFKNVVFAVINDHNSVANNYQIFADTFAR